MKQEKRKAEPSREQSLPETPKKKTSKTLLSRKEARTKNCGRNSILIKLLLLPSLLHER